VAFVVSLATGGRVDAAVRDAATWTVFAVLAAPLGHITYNEFGRWKLMLLGVLWMILLLPIASVVLTWAES
jgi:hypothetical protein